MNVWKENKPWYECEVRNENSKVNLEWIENATYMSQVNLNKTVFPLWIDFNSKSTN